MIETHRTTTRGIIEWVENQQKMLLATRKRAERIEKRITNPLRLSSSSGVELDDEWKIEINGKNRKREDRESPKRLEERKNPQRPLFHHQFSSHFSCSSADEFNFSPFNTQSSSSANLSSMYLKNPYNFGIAMPVDSFHTMGYQTGSLGQ